MDIRHNKMFTNVFLVDNLITIVSNKPSMHQPVYRAAVFGLFVRIKSYITFT